MSADNFRYFSSVEGRAVQRFGSKGFVGAKRTIDGHEWDVNCIVAISLGELARYGREYGRALAEGSLVERTAKEFAAQSKAESKAPVASADSKE
jgi:hypothetical protein